MAKRQKFDDSGDSEDLQALFDSIAATPAKPHLEVVTKPESAASDNPDLEALFDSVSSHFHEVEQLSATTASAVQPAPRLEAEPPAASDSVFNRLGQMTRQLHDTLRELGYDRLLQDTAKAIPDARQRLNYIAQMTEQAASRVLNATDIAKPIQDSLHDRSTLLSRRWDSLFDRKLTVEEFKHLAEETRLFMRDVPQQTAATNEQLMEIMMAQDFQDLTGQVIKRVVDLAQNLESELLQILLQAIPENRRQETVNSLINGPVINPTGRTDIVADQEQVDDLLESLGF